jgi:hypothetical protein
MSQHHFPDSKHLRGFIQVMKYSEIFFVTEIFGLHPQPYMLATALPPVANISGKHFLGALFILKVPLESIVLIAFDATKIRRIKRALESLL